MLSSDLNSLIELKTFYEYKNNLLNATNMKIEILKKALRIDSLSRLIVIEKKLKFIEEGKDQFVQLNDSNAEYLIRLFFDGSNISSPFLFKWKATKNETKIEIACDYLWGIGCKDVY